MSRSLNTHTSHSGTAPVSAEAAGKKRAVNPETVLCFLENALGFLIVVCLVTLAFRAALRLEDRWDTFMYHLPFAAIRGGLNIPYEMNDKMAVYFQGFPPLPALVQGLLWRITGSVNATGVVNYIAFLSFLAICQRKMGAPFYLVAAIALTAPLVLIHTTVSYVDLFGNSWLALGIVCLFYAYYFGETQDRWLIRAGLLGLAAAAWSKYLLVPLVAVFLPLYLVVYRAWRLRQGTGQRHALFWIIGAMLLAAAPYIKNWVEFGNPFWPVGIPWLDNMLGFHTVYPYTSTGSSTPPPLRGSSHFMLFIRSLFEIGHPHHYAYRPRWIIDQGNAWQAFRSGGFWNVSVVAYLLMTPTLLLAVKPRKGIRVIVAGVLLLLLVSVLPQAHELRYYMFLPLTWAGVIGILYRETRKHRVMLSIGVLLTVVTLFGYVSSINLPYYKIERIGYTQIAKKWGADRWWPRLRPGVRYCAVGVVPFGMMLTGPTMTEFHIIDRTSEDLCPKGTVHIGQKRLQAQLATMMQAAVDLIYRQKKYARAVILLDQILDRLPTHFGAMWQRAEALERSGQTDRAIRAWRKVVKEASARRYSELPRAEFRLARLEAEKQRH